MEGEVTGYDMDRMFEWGIPLPLPVCINCRCSVEAISESLNDNFGIIAANIRKPNVFGRFEKFWKEVNKLNKE